MRIFNVTTKRRYTVDFNSDGGNKKYYCPECKEMGQAKDKSLSWHGSKTVGRCFRCDGRFVLWSTNGNWRITEKQIIPMRQEMKIYDLEPKNKMLSTLGFYDQNILISALGDHLGWNHMAKALKRFPIGTAAGGLTIFWIIDQHNRIRGGKIMKYKGFNRDHNHKINMTYKAGAFTAKLCFFGQNQLKNNPEAPVYIVESEKTAFVASIFMPDKIFLATGGKAFRKKIESEQLGNRKIYLLPDIDAIDDWQKQISEIITTKLELVRWWIPVKDNGCHIHDKADIADCLLQYRIEEIQANQNGQFLDLEKGGSCSCSTQICPDF